MGTTRQHLQMFDDPSPPQGATKLVARDTCQSSLRATGRGPTQSFTVGRAPAHRRTATVTLFTVGRPGTALRWRLSRDDEANSRGGASGDRSPHSRREESPFQQTLLGNEDMCIVYIVSLSQLSLAWTRFKPQSSYSRKACATLSHMQHHQVRTLPSVRAFGFCVVHATTRETLQGVFAGGVSQIFTACGCCGRLRYSLGSSPPILACW